MIPRRTYSMLFLGLTGAAIIVMFFSYKQHIANIDSRTAFFATLASTPPCGGKYKVGHVFWNEEKTGGLTIVAELDGVVRSASFSAFGDEPQPQIGSLCPAFLNRCMDLCNC